MWCIYKKSSNVVPGAAIHRAISSSVSHTPTPTYTPTHKHTRPHTHPETSNKRTHLVDKKSRITQSDFCTVHSRSIKHNSELRILRKKKLIEKHIKQNQFLEFGSKKKSPQPWISISFNFVANTLLKSQLSKWLKKLAYISDFSLFVWSLCYFVILVSNKMLF